MPKRFKVGAVINAAYRVAGPLGSGGMGAVVRVVRVSDGEECALKYCTATDEGGLRRFAREVRAMERVSHPNVVPVLDHDLNYDPPYFVMPVAERSLDKEIPALAADHDAALGVFVAICAGVAAVHEAIGPHRDLKPHNVLRMRDGTVAVADFGLVKIDPRDTTVLTVTHALLGTNLYMAPEQKLPGGARDASVVVDIYALGATLFHLLTGKFPAVLDTAGLPPTLARIIRKSTALPSERYQSVNELARAVNGYLKLIRSPKDPLGIFSERLEAVSKRLADTGKYNAQEVAQLLLAVRGLLEDPEALLAEFDRIPDVILEKAAKRTPEELADALDAYFEAIKEWVSHRSFPYAETVARRMQRIFAFAEEPKLKALAVGATLSAAVSLNRFAAMDTLEEILLAVSTDEDAEAIAAVLRDSLDAFKSQAARYRRANVHRFIRAVVREAIVMQEDDEASDDDDGSD